MGAVAFILILGFYLIPTWVAASREHHQIGSIFIINLLLGWTFVGWVVALAMAVSDIKKKSVEKKIRVDANEKIW